MVIKNIWI